VIAAVVALHQGLGALQAQFGVRRAGVGEIAMADGSDGWHAFAEGISMLI